MFKITTPNINNSYFAITWNEEKQKGILHYDADITDRKSFSGEIKLNEIDFKKLCDICECTDWHIETFHGFDFTPDQEQRCKVWKFIESK